MLFVVTNTDSVMVWFLLSLTKDIQKIRHWEGGMIGKNFLDKLSNAEKITHIKKYF